LELLERIRRGDAALGPTTAEQVSQLAPDAASLKAAQGLATPAKWLLTAASEEALWGECKGSGANPYQVVVDLAATAFRCSCPSRKFPCKHALALLLLRVGRPQGFAADTPPEWAATWLEGRRKRAEAKQEKAEQVAKAPVDPEAAAKRTERRLQRMREGAAELERWLADQIKRGLAALAAEGMEPWRQLAARMVDAQAPGLAFRLKRIAPLMGQGTDWPRRVTAELGRLQLLLDGLRRLDSLPPPIAADLLAALGLPEEKEAIRRDGERQRDRWRVLGQVLEENERLWERRVWLHGQESGRHALLVDHSFGERRFDQGFLSGATIGAELAYAPGQAPLRALLLDAPQALDPAPLPAGDLEAGLSAISDHIARNPWNTQLPMTLRGDALILDGNCWRLRTPQGDPTLRLNSAAGWQLLALSGGWPLTLFGEWDGEQLRPLTGWTEAGLWSLPLV
jgi:hypothetical protein